LVEALRRPFAAFIQDAALAVADVILVAVADVILVAVVLLIDLDFDFDIDFARGSPAPASDSRRPSPTPVFRRPRCAAGVVLRLLPLRSPT